MIEIVVFVMVVCVVWVLASWQQLAAEWNRRRYSAPDAVERLTEHYLAGRLDVDEFESALDLAMGLR
jgi:uncharacterized membrane protein